MASTRAAAPARLAPEHCRHMRSCSPRSRAVSNLGSRSFGSRANFIFMLPLPCSQSNDKFLLSLFALASICEHFKLWVKRSTHMSESTTPKSRSPKNPLLKGSRKWFNKIKDLQFLSSSIPTTSLALISASMKNLPRRLILLFIRPLLPLKRIFSPQTL